MSIVCHVNTVLTSIGITFKPSIIKCCRTTGILVVTQFHRHYGQPGSEVPKCVDDIRRYMMLYFYTMMLQVQGKSLNNSRLEQYLTQLDPRLAMAAYSIPTLVSYASERLHPNCQCQSRLPACPW